MGSMRENIISDYVLNKVDFTNEWSVKSIKADLKKMLGEEPAFKVNYEKDVMLNEVTGESKEIKKIKSVNIIFTDDDDKYKNVEFLV